MTQKDFQTVIGYQFHNEQLLTQALTHSSYAYEQHMPRLSDNERLEFLGDAVLEIVSSEFLFQEYPKKPEGDLTKLRASIVCEPTLAECANELHLGEYLLLGKGEDQNGGRMRNSILSDAMEAIIGAIYLDGGYESAKKFVLANILTDIENKHLFYDSKTILQEMVQAKYKDKLVYELIHEEGPDHKKLFVAEVRLGDTVLGQGSGSTKKAAQQEAAYRGILKLREQKS